MITNILIIWIFFSCLGWLITIDYLDAWLCEELKIKHILTAIIFLPVTLAFILLAGFLCIFSEINDTKFILRIKRFLNKDI